MWTFLHYLFIYLTVSFFLSSLLLPTSLIRSLFGSFEELSLYSERVPMENDFRMNIVSLQMDRDAEASADLTQSNSFESGLTAVSSRGDADLKLDECTGWTNEKHNSYLDYLENSFVKQLYSLIGEETRRLSRTRDFTVLQNGCLQKVNFGKKQAHLETSSEFRFMKKSMRSNPENSNQSRTMGTAVQGNVLCNGETKHSGDKAFIRTYLRDSVGHEYPAQSTAEASGQNFKEEEEEKGCDSEVTRKREREANKDDSSVKDQVVPVRDGEAQNVKNYKSNRKM